jgi:exopolysaccharide production protein ExoY
MQNKLSILIDIRIVSNLAGAPLSLFSKRGAAMTFAPSNAQNLVYEDPQIYGQASPLTLPLAASLCDRPHLNITVSEDRPDLPLKASSVWSRVTDVILSATALIILLPALLLICFAIWITDRGPPIFAHRRIGKAGRQFPCLKFRTMVTDAQQRLADVLKSDPFAAEEWRQYQKLRNDPRITPIGHFLRRTSLDEIPQLVNVLIGQMSLVGPRPIVNAEVSHYGRYFRHYCSVRPGITGLWQVSGRSDTSYRRRVAMDTIYCRSKSITLDIAILTKTVPAVLMQRGAA